MNNSITTTTTPTLTTTTTKTKIINSNNDNIKVDDTVKMMVIIVFLCERLHSSKLLVNLKPLHYVLCI